MERKKDWILYTILGCVFFCGFLMLLGTYPLLEPDETRYVTMARQMFNTHDYMTLYLNGDYFFEKPPLYFWMEVLSFKLFGGVTEFTSRLPVVLISLLPLILTFGLCKKIKGIKFAIISSLTLLTCVEYVFITKLAILDGVLTSLVTSACLCYFYTFFVQDKNKKYFWILSYIFTGLSVLAKGIPGLVIPLGVIFVSTIIFKTYKETLKFLLLGILLILGITLPWHICMLQAYPDLFFNEYIYKHHIQRFLGSEVINRAQPWYFYILTLLWGLFPHIFALLVKMYETISKKIKEKEYKFNFVFENDFDKLIFLNIIATLVILIFFSSSGTKLITYILPIYPFLAIIIGKTWLDYIENGNKILSACLMGLVALFSVIAIVMPFASLILPKELYIDFRPIQLISIFVIIPYVVYNFKALRNNKRFETFLSLTLFIALFVGCLTPFIYKFDYSFGQNDLMKFAKLAHEKNYTISTYATGKKYSLLYYGYQKQVCYRNRDDNAINQDELWLNEELAKPNHIVIMRNKDIKKVPVKIKLKGRKYSIIEK